MADKVCCPGPIGGSNNSASAGGFREAVCVHTKKVYDSCRSKECLRDIRVYLTRDAQALLNAGGIVSVKPRAAELLCVKIDVERVQFDRGFYTIDIRFFYRIESEVSGAIGRPRIIDGLAVFDKRVVLFGGEGGARIFSSSYVPDGMDVQLCPDSNKPTAVVEVVDPILLDARIAPPESSCNCCCCVLQEVPRPICTCFDGDDLVLDNDGYQLFVTLGQFSIIRLERDIQLLMPAYDICLPRRDCSNSGIGGEQDPCEIFSNFDFPIDAFFPPRGEDAACLFTGAGGVNNGCGCGNSDHSGGCGCKK
ncbi:MAG: hypothetical protein Q4D31_06590 [Eubacteriales bacterium]|nr:hypothetical protein [Eubacteriales bacterium]